VAAVNLLSTVLKASDLFNGLIDDFKILNPDGSRFGNMESGVEPGGMFIGDEDVMMKLHEGNKKGGFFNRFK
jgi:hypothetical protein